MPFGKSVWSARAFGQDIVVTYSRLGYLRVFVDEGLVLEDTRTIFPRGYALRTEILDGRGGTQSLEVRIEAVYSLRARVFVGGEEIPVESGKPKPKGF